jgi:hypothetical protein
VFGKKVKNYQNEYLIGQVDERMNQIGCPICSLTDKAVHDYIDALFYENVNDPVERSNFIKGHGFCSKHLRMIEAHLGSHPELGILGVNILYHDLFEYLEDTLNALNKNDDKVLIGDGCELCEVEKKAEKRYLELFAEFFSSQSRREKYARSPAMVCLQHTYMLKEVKGFDFDIFLRIQKEKLLQLKHDMEEFIRKSDYRFSHEPLTSREGQAWKIMSKFLE